MSKQIDRTEEAQKNHKPGGLFHYELHVSASSLSEWGALQEDETLCSKEVTTLGGTEMRVLRFHSPVEAAEYGQPVLLIIRPHGKHCGCRPVYDFQGLR